jgi:arylamine N-acetyltransferase
LVIEVYLEHIGLSSIQGKPVDLELLQMIVVAHLSTFTYQNSDLFLQGLLQANLRKPNDISIESIFKQFIHDKRSGYCFQNIELLAWALEKSGFKLTRHLAQGINQLREKIDEIAVKDSIYTHELIIVELNNESWLVDTGYANNSLRYPLKIIVGEQEIADDKYYLSSDEHKVRLEMVINDEWFCLYDLNRNAKSSAEIFDAHQTLFTSNQNIPIRDNFYKLAKVTPNKRKNLCVFSETHSGFFKSHGINYKKEKEITTIEQFKEIAKKKFDIEINEEISQPIFSIGLN